MLLYFRNIILFLALLGVGLFLYSFTMEEIRHPKQTDISDNIDFEQYDLTRTPKLTIMDFGVGVFLSSFSFYLFLLLKKIKTYHDFLELRTTNKHCLIILSNIILLLWDFGSDWYQTFRINQGFTLPPDGPNLDLDEIFIPLALISLNTFVITFLTNSKLPAKLFISVNVKAYNINLLEIFFSSCIILCMALFTFSLIGGHHIDVLAAIYLSYLSLSLRAGVINKINTSTNNIHAQTI